MNFDEFRAATERARARERDREKAKAAQQANKPTDPAAAAEKEMLGKMGVPPPKGGAATASNTAPAPTSTTVPTKRPGLGDFLEMLQMQSLMCGILVLDTFAAFAELNLLHKKCHHFTDSAGSGGGLSTVAAVALTVVQSFTAFTAIFFGLELLAVILVFRSSVLGHIGYVVDILVVSLQLFLEFLYGYGRESRLLNVFRLWRTLRLFAAFMGVEKEQHERTKDALAVKDTEVRKLRMNVKSLENDVLKEKESKDAVEEMLLTYKEEVDTLNEALKIAAMDIAEVAQADDEDFDSEEGSSVREGEDEGDEVPPPAGTRSEVDDAADFVDAASSAFDGDKRRNRETLMRLVRRDVTTGPPAQGTGSGTGGIPGGGTTFVIHDDGTFERK